LLCVKTFRIKGTVEPNITTVYFANNIVCEGAYMADYVWGYFSEKDGERHSFDLCEDCYDAMIKNFKIPICIEKRTELM